MYKLIKLAKLLRVLKFAKEKNKIIKYAQDLLKISKGFQRLFFFLIFSSTVVHIIACLWVFFASLHDENYKGTWMDTEEIQALSS